jgi:hypothetical protein
MGCSSKGVHLVIDACLTASLDGRLGLGGRELVIARVGGSSTSGIQVPGPHVLSGLLTVSKSASLGCAGLEH